MNPPANVATEMTEANLNDLVHCFYAKVRRDPEIGPTFNAAVADWEEHLDKLANFWSTVMLASRRYKGNPMAVHFNRAITPPMFTRWLRLWGETTAELFAPQIAAQLQERAKRIGQNMQWSLFGQFAPEVDPAAGTR